jgi:hypothetical protein
MHANSSKPAHTFTANNPNELQALLYQPLRRITPAYGAGVQLGFFVVLTTKKTDGTEVAHEAFVKF